VARRLGACLVQAHTGVDETVRSAGVARNPCLDELISFRRLGAELIRREIFKQGFTFGGFGRIYRTFRPRLNVSSAVRSGKPGFWGTGALELAANLWG
jgi:hypothetical protein